LVHAAVFLPAMYVSVGCCSTQTVLLATKQHLHEEHKL
jgi:hypothetical protein